MTTEGPLANSQILRECEVVLTRSLPPDWRLNIIYGDSRNTGVADAVFSLVTPQGETIDYVIEVQRRPTTRRVLDTADQVYGYLENGAFRGSALIIADYLSPRSRQVLKDANVSFVDATGNVRLVNASPGLFIEASGARKNPWTEDVPLRSLKGRGAGRAIRALVDTRPPFGVRQLGLKTSVPIATLSRVIDLLERDALLDRDEDGGVVAVDWMNTIRRWSRGGSRRCWPDSRRPAWPTPSRPRWPPIRSPPSLRRTSQLSTWRIPASSPTNSAFARCRAAPT